MAQRRDKRFGASGIAVVADGELVGVVSLDSVVAAVAERLAHVATVIEAESPEYFSDEE